jgi:hypothetical protein
MRQAVAIGGQFPNKYSRSSARSAARSCRRHLSAMSRWHDENLPAGDGGNFRHNDGALPGHCCRGSSWRSLPAVASPGQSVPDHDPVHLVQYGDGGKLRTSRQQSWSPRSTRAGRAVSVWRRRRLEWRIPKRTAPGWGEPGARFSEAFGEIWRRRGNGAVFRENCRSLRF